MVGAASVAWLAAAPKATVEEGTNEKFFSLCVPLDGLSNQYTSYADALGADVAEKFANDLTALWMKWTQPK